jgi:cytochrome b subunit of formate dehydrogenase
MERFAHWLLLAVTALFLISGFGISDYRIVESLTLGLLTKNLSFRIHSNLSILLVALLGLHIYLAYSRRRDG